MFRPVLGALLRASGVPAAVRHTICRRRVTILVYHDPDPESLRAHLAYLRPRYNFIDLDTYVSALAEGTTDALPDRSLIITFDDGYARNGALQEVLQEAGVRPTIYVCSQIAGTSRRFWFKVASRAGRRLQALSQAERTEVLARDFDFSWVREYDQPEALGLEDIRRLRECASFGSHSRFHEILPTLTEAEAEAEIAESRTEVERLTGADCRHFCFPNGRYTERDIEIVRRAGYASARTLDPGFNGPNQDPYRLRAICVTDNASVSWLAVQLTGIPALFRHLRQSGRRKALSRQPVWRPSWLRPLADRSPITRA
ncbi:MAG TPA: polysaccharide deacetylase family protein [Vicinamibacterales bacterium]